jgi:hypothetical protein
MPLFVKKHWIHTCGALRPPEACGNDVKKVVSGQTLISGMEIYGKGSWMNKKQCKNTLF